MLPELISGRLKLPSRQNQDQDYLREAVQGVAEQRLSLDKAISEVVRGRSLKSVATVEMNVLRLAAWELGNRLEIPYRVIINEALELTRTYADESSRGFINGVLDKLADKMRAGRSGAAS